MRHLIASGSARLARALAAACLAAAVCLLAGGCSTTTIHEEEPAQPVGQIIPSKLAVVHTASIDGHFEQDDSHLGMATVAQMARSLEDEGYDVLLLDSGSALSSSGAPDLSYGELALGFMNAAGYDALALGTGELALGRTTLGRRLKQSDFAPLSANLIDRGTDEPLADPHKVFTLSDGRLVGVFAITAPSAADGLSPFALEGLDIESDDLVALAQEQVAELRSAGCRLVLCLANLGEEGAGGVPPLASQELASKVRGIDVLLDVAAADSRWESAPDASGEESLLVWTAADLAGASVVTWELGTLTVQEPDVSADHPIDEQVDALVTQAGLAEHERLATVLTTSAAQVPAAGSASGETALGDLVADAMLWDAGRGWVPRVDAALINGSALVAPLPKGDITRAGALAVCDHGSSRLCVVELSGRELQELLAAALASFPAGVADMPQVAGITLTIDPKAGAAKDRLAIGEVGGRPYDPAASYSLVTTEDIAAGTGPYRQPTLARGGEAALLEQSAATSLADYLAHKCRGSIPSSYEKPQGRVELLDDGEEKAQP